MKWNFCIVSVFIVALMVSCDQSPRDISTAQYTGRVYAEKPNHKDIGFVPSDRDIDEFETQLSRDLDSLLENSADTLVKLNAAEILRDIRKYKRRYYGVLTIESERMLIVEFIHPDCLRAEAQWRDSLWFPQPENYTYFSVHYYSDDKALFNLKLVHNKL